MNDKKFLSSYYEKKTARCNFKKVREIVQNCNQKAEEHCGFVSQLHIGIPFSSSHLHSFYILFLLLLFSVFIILEGFEFKDLSLSFGFSHSEAFFWWSTQCQLQSFPLFVRSILIEITPKKRNFS